MGAYAMQDTGHGTAQINITPLVDVMLVLLVIFMIAAPVAGHTISLDAQGKGEPHPKPSEPLVLRIDAAGGLSLGDSAVSALMLQPLLEGEAQRDPGRLLRIDASDDADYGAVAKALAAARNAGVERIAFARAER
jgi:biopolymer transport protein ExbD